MIYTENLKGEIMSIVEKNSCVYLHVCVCVCEVVDKKGSIRSISYQYMCLKSLLVIAEGYLILRCFCSLTPETEKEDRHRYSNLQRV